MCKPCNPSSIPDSIVEEEKRLWKVVFWHTHSKIIIIKVKGGKRGTEYQIYVILWKSEMNEKM